MTAGRDVEYVAAVVLRQGHGDHRAEVSTRIGPGQEGVVDPHEHTRRRHPVPGGGARGVPGHGGEGGRVDTLARNVTYHQRPMILAGLHDVEELAADVPALRCG